jgi:hypothetical protein
VKFCIRCGANLGADDASFCPECGVQVERTSTRGVKESAGVNDSPARVQSRPSSGLREPSEPDNRPDATPVRAQVSSPVVSQAVGQVKPTDDARRKLAVSDGLVGSHGLASGQVAILGVCAVVLLTYGLSSIVWRNWNWYWGLLAFGVGVALGWVLRRQIGRLPLIALTIGLGLVFSVVGIMGLDVLARGFLGGVGLWAVFGYVVEKSGEVKQAEPVLRRVALIGIPGAVVGLLLVRYWGYYVLLAMGVLGLGSLAFFKVADPQVRAARQLGVEQVYAAQRVDGSQLSVPLGPRPRVPTHMTWAILSLVFFFLPTAIAAIVNAANVNTLLAVGDVARAQEASRKARKWCWVSTIIGIVVWAISLIYYVVVIVILAGR